MSAAGPLALHVGVHMSVTDDAIRVDEMAREVEARGFESLWIPEHTHIPASRRTPAPGRAPAESRDLPREYSRGYDPFVALTWAAAATRTLRLGTSVCLIVQRDTIITAKQVACLDKFSGGRFLFGIGAGWNAEEMENHGTAFVTRFKKMGEQVRAMKEIWTKELAEFHGDFVSFDPIWCWPKPAQAPHPPVLLGGESTHTMQRVVDYGEGWLPRIREPEVLAQRIGELRERAAKAGRDSRSISVTVFNAGADRQHLDGYRTAGATRVLLRVPPEGRDTVLPLLDRYATLLS